MASPDDDNNDPLTDWNEQLKSLLDDAESAGAALGVTKQLENFPALHPKLEVEGLEERIAYPLTSAQAKQLIEIAKKTNKGQPKDDSNGDANDAEGALVATAKPWKIDASMISFREANKWNLILADIVRDMALKLGVNGRVDSQLQYMMLCEAGCVRDTSRGGDGAQHSQSVSFGVLEIQLPSLYQGGLMTIFYKDEPKLIMEEYAEHSQDAYFATAFFNDCEQHAEMIASGYRLSLVYQLRVDDPRIRLLATEGICNRRRELRELASSWEDGAIRGYLLDREYPGNLNDLWFTSLTGHDNQVVKYLQSATDIDGNPLFVVHLALLEKWECVTIPEDSDEIDEVLDSHTRVSAVVDTDGNIFRKITMLPFDIDWDLFFDGEDVDDIFRNEPDEGIRRKEDVHEFTYYRVALIFWPHAIANTVAFESASSSKRLSPGVAVVGWPDGKRARVEVLDDVEGAGRADDPFVLE